MKLKRKILLILLTLIALSNSLIIIFSDIDVRLKILVGIALIISIILLRQLSIVRTRCDKLYRKDAKLPKPPKEDRYKELKDRLSICEKCENIPYLAICIKSFQEKKGYNNAQVSDRCWIDSSNYRKILTGERTNLDKETVIKIAYGLTMTLEEAKELLHSAGYSFSKFDKFDIIIQYCLKKNYDPGQTDEILFKFNLHPLFDLKYKEIEYNKGLAEFLKREERFMEIQYRLSQCKKKQDLIGYINSFQEKKGYKNAEVSDRCRISNYHKIVNRNQKRKNPDKKTVIKIAYGLTMTLEEAQELLHRAGYSFSKFDKFDTIIKYCLEKEYDPGLTDDILFKFNLHPLFDVNKQDLAGFIYSFQLKKGYKSAEVSERCCIDLSYYRKILTREITNLDKKTVIKIAYGLTMTLEETKILLRKAGYSFTETDPFDFYIMLCLKEKCDPGATDAVLEMGCHKPLFDIKYVPVNKYAPKPPMSKEV